VFFFKLGLLTCAIYAALTIVFDVALKGIAYFRGGGITLFASGKHPILSLGAVFGVIFGVLWLISFSAAWWIVYPDRKSKFAILSN
jgi:hypothetical protein